MERKLVITKMEHHICTTCIENGTIVEFHISPLENQTVSLGDIYVGKVKKIVPNIRAAFIEIKPGIECYYDMDSNPDPFFTKKIGKKELCQNDELLVQVEKEAVKTKAPTVTSKISFPGKYVVLTSGDVHTGVSHKLDASERERLFSLLAPYKDETYGIIARTNAKGIGEDLLISEIEQLKSQHDQLLLHANTRTVFSCLKKADASYLADIRNVFVEGLVEILVEDHLLYEEIHSFMETTWTEGLKLLTHYHDKTLPLQKLYNIDQELNRALGEHVWLKSGAYLVIQPTEALTVIDVNTGKCVTKKNKEEQYYQINVQAAVEAAKQIRLRNISGIVIIDFINMKDKDRMQEVLKKLNQELKKDRIKTILVDVTKLQLVEITRQKIRKSLKESFMGRGN